MILGYLISPCEEDYYMFEGLTLGNCANYSDIYHINKINPDLAIKSKKNLFYIYEGFIIISERFKEFCERERYRGIEFIYLPGSPEFYWLKVNNIIEYDTDRRGTEFLNYNEECKGYEEIIGASPACLKNNSPLPDGIFRSDICFGSYAAKSPLYYVGAETKNKLKEAGFKEIYLEKILDKYKWEK